ncbi:hypothetical protein F0726_02464 [Acidithiobacillus caldus]|nr:hypothetical protein F0726_02464 [Acidithiobacillus caldus]
MAPPTIAANRPQNRLDFALGDTELPPHPLAWLLGAFLADYGASSMQG